ncbi:magnesium chelatase family protein [Caldalkalibacillus uzonensis]|uniref:Magnesium chelatase family protein n=2 Tax=Caldalkalibacillus uzonensis TaxID=353224 RepID=A0ABU0CYD7_9BACI|nr:magnesium chelatase family protein [Caldalkalibacillus uzonensis]
MDRIDLQVDVPLLSYDEIVCTATPHNDHYSTSNIRQRVEQALLFKQERTKNDKPNGLLTVQEVKATCQLTKEAEDFMREIFEHLQLSMRGYHKILKVARTIADLNGHDLIEEEDIAEAVGYRLGK